MLAVARANPLVWKEPRCEEASASNFFTDKTIASRKNS